MALTYTGVGNCVIDANQAGNANYNAAPQVQKTITIGKGSPDHHLHPAGQWIGGGRHHPVGHRRASGNPSPSPSTARPPPGRARCPAVALTYTGVGNCVVDANQAGSANYNAAPQVQKTITVGKGSQTITFTPPATGAVGGGTTLSATGGGSGNPVTFTVDGTSTAGACTLTGTALTYTGVGNCVVDANQAGNANYNAAPQVQQTITVGKGAQTITFTPPTTGTVGGGTTLSATGGASGNPVTFTIDGIVHRRGLLAVRLGPHLHRRGQLRGRRQPGRQRQLQRRPPGPEDRSPWARAARPSRRRPRRPT